MLALTQEALVADMQIIAVDLAFDAEADAVFGLLAFGNVGAELARLDAQRLRHRMLQPRFRGGRKPDQMPRRDRGS